MASSKLMVTETAHIIDMNVRKTFVGEGWEGIKMIWARVTNR